MLCTRNALSGAKEQFAAGDPVRMAELSGAELVNNTFYLNYCNIPVAVKYPDGTAALKTKHPPLSNDENVLLLHYLSNASGLPLRGQWLSFLDLQGGPLHWHSLQKEALNPLARHYHAQLDRFLEAGTKHGGKRIEMGDCAILVPVLPRLPLKFIIWQGDEEFGPRSTILFDSVSEAYFSTAALYVLAIQALIRIWFPGDTRFDEVVISTAKE